VRYDRRNRRRWLDAVWEEARIIVEIDGIHHMDAAQIRDAFRTAGHTGVALSGRRKSPAR
jgi:very-short-patch-repair endonuclease